MVVDVGRSTAQSARSHAQILRVWRPARRANRSRLCAISSTTGEPGSPIAATPPHELAASLWIRAVIEGSAATRQGDECSCTAYAGVRQPHPGDHPRHVRPAVPGLREGSRGTAQEGSDGLRSLCGFGRLDP